MRKFKLYFACLRKVTLLLIDGMWTSSQENPFRHFPSNVVDDLMSAALLFQNPQGYRAAHLEHLLTCGKLREFKIDRVLSLNLKRQLGRILKYLGSGSQSLEGLTLIYIPATPEYTNALHELLRNSPNLKYLRCAIEFDLRALRNCRKLRTVILQFPVKQPWYDFLAVEHDCLQPLDSLELFAIARSSDYYPHFEEKSVFYNYLGTVLRYCPALASLGIFETSRTLSYLYRNGILSQVKLRCCYWGLRCQDPAERFSFSSSVPYAVECNPDVEELHFFLHSVQSIIYLSRLRNLTFLDIEADDAGDLNVPFCNVLKHIGLQLKHLSFEFKCPMDISILLEKCPNLQALRICIKKYEDFARSTVSLRYLKYLSFRCTDDEDDRRVLSLLSDCHNLKELFIKFINCCHDKSLDYFLRRNSLSNLKVANFYSSLSSSQVVSENFFRKLFLNAPELENFQFRAFRAKRRLALQTLIIKILRETNHKATFSEMSNSYSNEFFTKRRRIVYE